MLTANYKTKTRLNSKVSFEESDKRISETNNRVLEDCKICMLNTVGGLIFAKKFFFKHHYLDLKCDNKYYVKK